MTRAGRLSHIFRHNWKTVLAGVVGFVLTIITLSTAWAGWETFHTLQALRHRDLTTAAHHAQRAKKVAAAWDTITGKRSTFIRLLYEGLAGLIEASETQRTIQQYLPLALQGNQAARPLAMQLQQQLTQLNEHVQRFSTTLTLASSDRHIFQRSDTLVPQVAVLQELSATWTPFITAHLRGHHKYIILLQNSDELRATGGFVGSYAVIELDDGVVTRLDIHDIYAAAGQVKTPPVGPPGVAAYLSSGSGKLQLPDANWSPDFPTTAQTMLAMFAQAGEREVDGVISCNVEVIKDILNVTGALYLPDQRVTVTPENFTDVARSGRSEFFPGSQQKAQLLTSLFTQLKEELVTLNTTEQLAIVASLGRRIRSKDIQFFTHDKAWQTQFERAQVAGQVRLPAEPAFPLYLVESNVGINKVNKFVSREVQVATAGDTITISVRYTNTSPQNEAYINYLRVLLPPTASIEAAYLKTDPLKEWDDAAWVSTSGVQLREYGFLVPVPVSQPKPSDATQPEPATFTLVVHNPNPQTPPNFWVMKQAGLAKTHYTLLWVQDVQQTTRQDLWLEGDTLVKF